MLLCTLKSWWFNLQIPMQPMHITIKDESSNIDQMRRGVLDTTLCDKVCQSLAAYSGLLQQQNWQPPYNWNIAECDSKNHNPHSNSNDFNLSVVFQLLRVRSHINCLRSSHISTIYCQATLKKVNEQMRIWSTILIL